MNQLYRALRMPKGRLLRKISGEKEIYTIAIRPAPVGQGCEPLPALGGSAYTPLPYTPGTWYADPLLHIRDGKPTLFCEAFDMAANHGRLVACEITPEGGFGPFQTVLEEPFHLSFPNVFAWNDALFMLPETGADHSLRLYRCVEYPAKWECVQRFEVGRELCDAIVTEQTPDSLQVLCSETKPENQLLVRYRRYTITKNTTPPKAEQAAAPQPTQAGEQAAAPQQTQAGEQAAAPEPYTLQEDEAFNLDHRAFDYTSRNAGPLFTHDGLTVHPTQVSTSVDYGVYLQFFTQRARAETPLCAANAQNVAITGIDAKDIIGIHTYCRGAGWEIIDARYLRKP